MRGNKTNNKSRPEAPTDHLTRRELDIIIMHMQGKSRKDIARAWGVSVSTIDTHIKHIHVKTNTRDVQGVIKYGHDHGLNKIISALLLIIEYSLLSTHPWV